MRPHCTTLAAFVVACLGSYSRLSAEGPVAIGGRRELFVDRSLVEKMSGTELRMHTPQSAGVALTLDRPWEGIVSGYFTVLQDGERRLMYYRGRPSTTRGDASDEAREVTCVVESADGIHWTRPRLGLFEVSGTFDNNVCLVEPKTVTHNFCPFLDARPGVPAGERFKAVGGTGSGGLFGYSSPDGIHWKSVSERPLITKGYFDSQNIVFWSTHEGRYLCYFRTWRNDVRWVARSTSTNFLDWSEPQEMEFGGAPAEHIYVSQTQPYFRAPHLYLGLAVRFNQGRHALTDEQVRALDLENPRNYAELRNDDSDVVLLSSRGGNHYDRTFLESYLRPGLDPRNWVARANYPALGLLQTSPTELSMFVGRHYGQPSIHLERMTLRLDGFVSVHAPYSGGELTTVPIVYDGSELEVNVETSAAGSLRVELQNEAGEALPGVTLGESDEIIGDSVERKVRWKGDGDLGRWSGKPVRVRFVMKDADLYSYRFRGKDDSASAPAKKTVTVCADGGAGGYEAFPDVCRLPDGRLACIFYASYTHVGVPTPEWPKGGRIAICWSSDDGKTWTPAETLFDSPADDRDPSLTVLKDGRLLCSFFTSTGAQVIEARDSRGPWSAPKLVGAGLGVSSPVRELSDGTLILGAYYEKDDRAHGMILRSTERGKAWESPIPIDSGGQFLDAETDVVELKNGELIAALRGGKGAPMNVSRSRDQGKSWNRAEPLGFVGHCPYLHRTLSGEVVLAYRQPVQGPTYGTALRVSRDEGKQWSEAYGVDSVIGAYPSMVNLRDGAVLIVYYEEGKGSNIRARKFRVSPTGVEWLGF
jgi:hypothetical protein